MSSNNATSISYENGLPSLESRLNIEVKLDIKFTNKTNIIRVKQNKSILFTVDTGATHTIIPASNLLFTDEYKFREAYGLENYIGVAHGINSSIPIYSLPFKLDSITIGEIGLTDIEILTTFDPDINACLLGMDILGLFITEIDPENRILTFTETDRLARIKQYGIGDPKLIDPILPKEPSISRQKLTTLDLIANAINNKIKNNQDLDR